MLLLALLYVCVYTMEKYLKSIRNMWIYHLTPSSKINKKDKTAVNGIKQAHYDYQHSLPVIISALSENLKM